MEEQKPPFALPWTCIPEPILSKESTALPLPSCMPTGGQFTWALRCPHSKGEARHLWTGSSVVLAEVPGTREALSMCGPRPHSSGSSSTVWYQRSLFPLGSRTTEGGTRAGREAKTPRDARARPESGLWSICQAPNPVSTYSPGLIITSSPRAQASSSPCEANEIFKWKRGDLLDDLLGRAPRDYEL